MAAEVNRKNNRKTSKPLMEKRRRARINQSLAELKELVVRCGKSEMHNCRRSTRLEKADILELTVRHLHRLHKITDHDTDPAGTKDSHHQHLHFDSIAELVKFRAGFRECVHEIKRYLQVTDEPTSSAAACSQPPSSEWTVIDQPSKAHLFRHLSGRLRELSNEQHFGRGQCSSSMANTKPEPPRQLALDPCRAVHSHVWRPW